MRLSCRVAVSWRVVQNRGMSESGRYDCDVAIVGGGPVGLALSLALAREGMRSIVFDSIRVARFRDPEFDGRAYAMSLASRRLLDRVGVWAEVSDRACRIVDILVTDGRVGKGVSPLFLRFREGEVETDGLGHMIEDRYLRNALLDRVEAEPGVELRSPQEVLDTRPDGVGAVVETADGKRVRARMIAACDGRASRCARRAGIRRTEWRYRQTAIVCAVRHEKPHGGVAHEYFLPAGPFAILPLPGNLSSIVWAEDPVVAEYLRGAGSALFESELRKRFGGFLGSIEVVGRRWSYGLELSLAQKYVAERLALVGDAAHRIHPIAGQGLNVGYQDVAAIAEILSNARRRGEDLGDAGVLGRYQAARRFDSTALAFATDSLDRLFSNDLPLVRLARDAGMAAVGRVGPLRRFFMARAAGLGPRMPRSIRNPGPG